MDVLWTKNRIKWENLQIFYKFVLFRPSTTTNHELQRQPPLSSVVSMYEHATAAKRATETTTQTTTHDYEQILLWSPGLSRFACCFEGYPSLTSHTMNAHGRVGHAFSCSLVARISAPDLRLNSRKWRRVVRQTGEFCYSTREFDAGPHKLFLSVLPSSTDELLTVSIARTGFVV